MPSAPSRVKAVFLAALDADAAARPAVLDDMCAGDDELRRRVEAMLRANDRADPLLDHPAADHLEVPPRAAAAPRPAEERGTEIAGRYRLREIIGEGGMGTVWLAEQTEPVRRTVALKVIKAGMDSRSVIARFDAERQALAVMDHPHIAKVLDGGTISGVRRQETGVSKTDLTPDSCLLTPDARPFFVMEYVPGVPLTEYCDAEHIDVAGRLALFVQVCQAVQHAHQKGIIHRDLKPSNILVRKTDGGPVPKVIDFGLAKAVRQPLTEASLQTGPGVLMGTLQYMAPEQAELDNPDVDTRADVYALGVILYELLTGTTPLDKQRLKKASWLDMLRLIQEEEPPKPSTRLSGSGSLPDVAAHRSLEPARLTRLVRGDLDWIVMKALEKDRSRRYDSAGAFAADVGRYLAGDPVAAHPPGTGYRLRKFVRRHRGRVAAAGLVVVALLAGITGTTVGLIRAESRRQEAETARADEADQRQAAETARAQEADQRARAEQALERNQTALNSLLTAMIGHSLTAPNHHLTPEQKKFLGEVLTHFQEVIAERGDDERSRVRAARAANRVALIQSRLGRAADADDSTRLEVDLWTGLAADFRHVAQYRQSLAVSRNNLGIRLAGEDAGREYRKAVEILEALRAEFPATAGYREDLAASYVNLGEWSGPGRPEGEDYFRRAIDLRDQLVADRPADAGLRDRLAKARWHLGQHFLRRGDRPAAEEQFRLAIEVRDRLTADHPAAADLPEYRRNLGVVVEDLGLSLRERGEAPAEPYYRRVAEIRGRLADEFPDRLTYQIEYGGTCSNLGGLLTDSGRPDEALPWCDKAVRILTAASAADSQSALAREYLGSAHATRGLTLRQLRKHDEAVADWDNALRLSPDDRRAWHQAQRAYALAKAGKTAGAAAAELAGLTRLTTWHPREWYNFARAYAHLSGQVADKKEEYADRAIELLGTAVRAGFDNRAHAARDEDFAPVRDRADFQKLLAEMGQKKP